jgi:hypothetical protein
VRKGDVRFGQLIAWNPRANMQDAVSFPSGYPGIILNADWQDVSVLWIGLPDAAETRQFVFDVQDLVVLTVKDFSTAVAEFVRQ